MSEHESANKLSSRTTPTWEVELLISGIAVFAMLQLPGWLDDSVFALDPRLTGNWHTLLVLLYFYGKSAAVILAATFVIHLLLRARWIALVGMHSVYPDGVRWERLRMGPLQREIEQRHQNPTEAVIERADNRATIVFALGVMISIMFVIITAVLGLAYGAVNLLAQATGWRPDPSYLLLGLFAVVMLPFGLITTLDRQGSRRLSTDGPVRRIASALMGFYVRIGLGRSSNRIMALLSSHGGERRMIGVTMAIMGAAIVGVIVAHMTMRDPMRVGSYALFPRTSSDGSSVQAAHYDDQREPSRDDPVPFVQSSVIVGPYLRLVVPYQPRRSDPALRRHCPAIHAAAAEPRAAGTLACLQAMHALVLDGKPLAAQRFDIGSDARTDRPALLAMIDIRTLPPGRHELQVGQPPTDEPDADAAPVQLHRIPFWR